MGTLVDQIQALRIPPELRRGQDEQLNHHMTKNVLGMIHNTSTQKLAHDGIDPLTRLDPFQDSLAYLYIIMAQIELLPKGKIVPPQLMPGQEIWQKIVRFVTSFDSVQIRYGGKMWFHFVDVLVKLGPLGKSNNISATSLLAQAMLRLDPTCGTLTTNHLDLVRMAMNSASYSGALPVLDCDHHSLVQKSGPQDTFPCSHHRFSSGYMTVENNLTEKMDRNDVMEYYLVGAMVYIGVSRWDRAKYFLEHVLSTPTTQSGATTGIMLEAYKKWVLVSLLAKGRGGVPKAASAGAIKTLRSLAKVYEAIAEAFKNQDRRRIRAEADEAHNQIAEDRNIGLVNAVMDYAQEVSIRKLGEVYAAVPLSRVAEEYQESPVQIEAYLRTLIQSRRLHASITEGNAGKVLRFDQIRDQSIESEKLSRDALVAQTQKIEDLAAHVSAADRRLALTKEFLDWTARKSKGGAGQGPLDEMGFAGRLAAYDEGDDENMMTDEPLA